MIRRSLSRTTPRFRRSARLPRCAWILLAAGVATAVQSAQAEDAKSAPPAPVQLQLKLRREQLPNGLRVVLNVDHASPTIAVCVTYDVGSRNEVKGRSGFAHLFEHMMFQGSRNLEKGDHFKLISSRGGTLNGTTSSDRTNYFESLPSSALELGLWLEADRMKSLAVTQENFENQRAVVQEEYRMRVSNQAYALGMMKLHELAYGDYWSYAHDAIGSMDDLDAAKLPWIREFHHSYYAPNNAVLSVTGDFDPEQAMAYVRKYFSDAKPTQIPAYQPGEMAAQTAQRAATVEDVNARTPGLFNAWPIPPNRTPEHYALEMASVMLGVGETSLLHQSLVRDIAVARSALSWTLDRRGPDLFSIRVLLSDGAKVEDAQAAVDKLIERLRAEGPSAEELDKARNRLKSFFIFGLQDNMSRATELANYELFTGDARNLNTELDRYLAVTAAQVQAAVQKYLTPEARNVLTVLPTAASESK